MKIVIFGASGRTGLPLVEQALAAGHQVVAFVRDPSKLGSAHQNLTVVQGDVMSATAVANAVSTDTDAVISVLHNAQVREVAERLGLSVTSAEGAVSALSSAELAPLAEQARAADVQLAGGASTVVISTTTLLLVLIIVILLVR